MVSPIPRKDPKTEATNANKEGQRNERRSIIVKRHQPESPTNLGNRTQQQEVQSTLNAPSQRNNRWNKFAQPNQNLNVTNQSVNTSYCQRPRVKARCSSGELLQMQQKLLLENPAPYVSATNWTIIDSKKGDILFGKCETEMRQVASLTKIMTSYCVLNLVDKFQGISAHAGLTSRIRIMRPVSEVNGTTAKLQFNDILTVEELMYGMMLPSGNDAAQALAIHYGQLLLSKGTKDPEIVISKSAVERRLLARKIQIAMEEQIKIEQQIEEQNRKLMEKEKELQESLVEGSQTQQAMYERVSHFDNSLSKAFTDCSSKQTNVGLDQTPLSAVDSEINFNHKFMGTSDTSFGEYQDYSPLTFRAYSPSPRRNRGSLLFSGSLPLGVNMEEQSNQTFKQRSKLKTIKQIEDLYEGQDIPNTPARDLPKTYNEVAETNRMERQLLEQSIEKALSAFYSYMNECAGELGLTRSHFAVAHGMHHPNNYSCAHDIALLSRVALQTHSLLREIVNTKQYAMVSRTNPKFKYEWENTNYMLWHKDGPGTYSGIKTGVTPTAGPCLSVNFRSRCGQFNFIVVVLNCKTREARFVEIPKLINWAMQKIIKVRKAGLKPSIRRRLLRNMVHV